MLDCCITNIGLLNLLVDAFTYLVMSLASCGMLILFTLTPIILSLLYIPLILMCLLFCFTSDELYPCLRAFWRWPT